MNLFLAILIGNFEEASLIMRDTKFLITLQKQNEHTLMINGGIPMLTEEPLMSPTDELLTPTESEKKSSQAHIVNVGPRPLIVVDEFLKTVKKQKLRGPSTAQFIAKEVKRN
jgi:hypothetical protein